MDHLKHTFLSEGLSILFFFPFHILEFLVFFSQGIIENNTRDIPPKCDQGGNGISEIQNRTWHNTK